MFEKKAGRPASGNYRHDSRGFNTLFRWMPYEHCDPPIDFDGILMDSLELTTNLETVVDVGCGPPRRLYDLYSLRGHRGKLIGIDPYPEQFEYFDVMYSELHDYEDFKDHVELLPGRFQNLPLDDNTADRILSEYSMYLVPPREQSRAMAEIKRVMKDDGIFVLSTSATDNKMEQRKDEKKVAEFLELEPPKLMNANYDSARAIKHLGKHFREIETIPMHSHMRYKTPEDLEAYLFSLYSMKDQFDPIPHHGELDSAIKGLVREEKIKKLESEGEVLDICARDLFICRFPIDKE